MNYICILVYIIYTGWWFVFFSKCHIHIGNFIVTTDFHIFQRGRSTINQLLIIIKKIYIIMLKYSSILYIKETYYIYIYICPRCSMYGICTYIWVVFGVNVGKYSSTMEHMGIYNLYSSNVSIPRFRTISFHC